MKNVSSQEELLQLRDEGKISEAEYNDLLAAIRKPPPENVEEVPTAADDARTKRKQGKIAFVLMLVGIVPAVLYWLSEMAAQAHDANMHSAIGPWFFLCVAFEIAAFVLGIIAWSDYHGKITVTTIAAMVVLALLTLA